jgi:hypothetical protein
VVLMVSASILIMENGTRTIMVMWEMASPILLWRSADVPFGVGGVGGPHGGVVVLD